MGPSRKRKGKPSKKDANKEGEREDGSSKNTQTNTTKSADDQSVTSDDDHHVVEDGDDVDKRSWLTSFAVLGDSWLALVASLFILLLAIGVSFHVDSLSSSGQQQQPDQADYEKLGPIPHVDPPTIFRANRRTNASTIPLASLGILSAYNKDGVVAVFWRCLCFLTTFGIHCVPSRLPSRNNLRHHTNLNPNVYIRKARSFFWGSTCVTA